MSDRQSTVCPCCAVGCHLTRRSDSDRAVGRPGPSNPDGRLCRAGIAAFEKIQDRDRLSRPLVRRDSALEPTTWDNALSETVARFRRIRARHGADALAFLGAPHATTEANYQLQKLARTLGTNNVDNRARHCHGDTARALGDRLGWPATTNSLDDLPDADVILVVGADPAQRQPVAFDAFVRPAVHDGTTLVHVDPVGSATTRLADVHLSPRPGTDAVVLNLLAVAVLDSGGVDEQFVAQRTRGFETYRSGLQSLDMAKARATAGVDGDRLQTVADRLVDADRTAAIAGTGIEGDTASGPDALLNLLLATGNVGRRGTGVHLFRGLANEQGAVDAGCVPDRLPGHRSVTDPTARSRVADVWGVDPPSKSGHPAPALLAGFGETIHGALVVGENPAVSKHDPDWIARRLDSLDTLVVADIGETETTTAADVVLPAAAGVEVSGTVTNLDRQIQRLNPVEDPPRLARPDTDILGELGTRLVGGTVFDATTPAAVFDELAEISEAYEGILFNSLEEYKRWPADSDEILYQHTFETADGRAPFVPIEPFDDVDIDDRLTLVVGGRMAESTTERPTLHIHPSDASTRGLEDGDTVVVSDDGVTVELTATVTDTVRRGTVYTHATIADPLVRTGVSTVAVERSSPNRQ